MKFIFACVLFALAVSTVYSAVPPFPYKFSGTYTAPAAAAAAYDYAASPYYFGAGYYNGDGFYNNGFYNGAYYAAPAAGYFAAAA